MDLIKIGLHFKFIQNKLLGVHGEVFDRALRHVKSLGHTMVGAPPPY